MKQLNRLLVSASMIFGLLLISTSKSYAYSCKAVYIEAESLIEKAEGLINKNADSCIKAMIEAAKGLANSCIISHKVTNDRDTGAISKCAHGDALRKDRGTGQGRLVPVDLVHHNKSKAEGLNPNPSGIFGYHTLPRILRV